MWLCKEVSTASTCSAILTGNTWPELFLIPAVITVWGKSKWIFGVWRKKSRVTISRGENIERHC